MWRRTDPKYRDRQLSLFRQPDEKVMAKLSKLYNGTCLGYFKTAWLVYVAIVLIDDKYEFCWLDEGYIKDDGPKSWGVQKVDYFIKVGKGWDLYFEHVWHWIGTDEINQYFDYVFRTEDVIYAEDKPVERESPPELVSKPTIITKVIKRAPKENGGQLDLFEFVS